eukprot:TRINITY_DN5970_c1_g2_i1.p1 TRINITY_DN5970_c1_g2~~TRINITY_DN5970_c1_g2_i1.p1  ORF type:complete len:502 (-),score=124.26 TRINITY_DN5970_c1_g2_i1:18-1523(-)
MDWWTQQLDVISGYLSGLSTSPSAHWKVISGAVVALLVIYKSWPLFRQWRKAGTPGVPYLTTWRRVGELQYFLKEWMTQKQVYKGWYHLWIGFDFTMLTADADCAHWVYKHNELEKTGFVGIPKWVDNYVGSHLLFANGDDWKRQRSVINSGFGKEQYKSYYPSFNQIIDRLLYKFNQIPEGIDINVSSYLSKFTLDLLGKSIFHYEFNYLNTEKNSYYDAYRTLMTGGGRLNQLLVEVIPGWSHLPFSAPKRFKDAIHLILSLFKRVIEDHQKQEEKYDDVLDKLLHSQQDHKLSEVELYSNIWAFFAAGHETTATALSWAFAELADKQDLQQRLYEHIISEFPSVTLSVESILEPPTFLDCFIKENLRHHPPISVIPGRRAVRDLQCGIQTIPKGTRVGVDIWAVHHNPYYWENPNVFDPDRFLPERRKERHKFSYLPFGLGPRQCIGNEFSEIEQRLFLVKFLRDFRVLPPTKEPITDLERLPNFGSAFPVYVRIVKR